MEFRVLGPLEVIGPGGPIKIGGRMRRAILALLLLHRDNTVGTDRLIEEIWGDDPPRGSHALEVHVFGLRRALGADRIEAQPGGYRLRVKAMELDLERFEALVSDASCAVDRRDPLAAAAGFAAALALWRGPALGDLASSDVLRGERARLDDLRVLVLERWIDAELAAGHHLDVIPDLRRIVDEMPLREAFQARLMLALYRSGRQSEALDVYREARAVLDRELGVDPGKELESLQRAVLGHDPGLAAELHAEPQWLTAPSADASPAAAGAPVVQPDQASSIQFASPQGATRRIVTILVASARAATSKGERLDPESGRLPMDRSFEEMRAVLEHHGGLVERVVGDAIMAVFGAPVTHDDDALRAVLAASEMRDAVAARNAGVERQLGVRIAVRVGVNTGEVLTDRALSSASLVTGDAVNAAMWLAQAARPDEVLIDGDTYGLVRSAVDAESTGLVEIDGPSGLTSAVRLLGVILGSVVTLGVLTRL